MSKNPISRRGPASPRKALSRRLLLLRLAPDTVERHRAVAGLITAFPGSVLDVGGNRHELAAFLVGREVHSINVGDEGDLTYDGRRLPFDDDSFAVVTSLDVLEHVAAEQRSEHVRELLRVARAAVVLCCPAATPRHLAVERDLASWYEALTGRRHRFLDEHLALGLPTLEELGDIAAVAERAGFATRLTFSGDFERTAADFRLTMEVRTRPRPASVLRYVRSRSRTPQAPVLADEPGPRSNRAFLVARRV